MQDISIQINRSEFAHKQISRHFEELIVSGRLKPGERIAPTSELAQRFSVTPNTVQKSLALLASKGLLLRSQKRGTIVSPSVCSQTLGLIFGFADMSDPDRKFWATLLLEIKKASGKMGWKCKPYLGLDENFDQVIHELENDIARGVLKAIVPLCYPSSICNWLNNTCEIPWSGIELAALCDYETAVSEGISYLTKHNRRNILILASSEEDDKSDFHTGISKLNLPSNVHINWGKTNGRAAGYETAKKLLFSKKARPDALFVIDDRACEGVVTALNESGLKIPSDMALLSLANKGVEIVSPVPVTRIEFDPADFAKAVLDDLTAKIEGGNCLRQRIILNGTLSLGRSCGES